MNNQQFPQNYFNNPNNNIPIPQQQMYMQQQQQPQPNFGMQQQQPFPIQFNQPPQHQFYQNQFPNNHPLQFQQQNINFFQQGPPPVPQAMRPQPIQTLGPNHPKQSRWNQKGDGEAVFNYNNVKDTKVNRGFANPSENLKIEELRPGQLVDLIKFNNQLQSQNRIPVRAYQEHTSQDLTKLVSKIHLQKKPDNYYKQRLEDLKSSIQKDIDNEKYYIQKEKDKQRKQDEQNELMMKDYRDDDNEYTNQAYGKTYDKRSQIQINESRLKERLEENKIGLGANRPIEGSQEDIYSRFRQNRSVQYHVSAEERHFTRDRSDRCYKCNQPGHIARDCQFGLT